MARESGEWAAEGVELTVSRNPADEVPPYARLLEEAIAGDPTLFAREDAIEAAWQIVEPVLGDAARFTLRARDVGTARGGPAFERRRRLARPRLMPESASPRGRPPLRRFVRPLDPV